MKRHLRILDSALSALARNRARTLVVLVVYALLVFLFASLLLFVDALRREARLLLDSSPELIVQRVVAGRHELMPLERADEIRAIRGVGRVTPRVWGYSYDPPTGATFTLWGADSVPPEALEFEEGALPAAGEPSGCVVGRGVADARFLGIGDRLPLKGADGSLFAPRVAGVFTTSSSLLTNDLVVLPTAELRRLFAMDSTSCTDLAVAVHHPQEVATVARKIQERWPDARTVSRRQLIQTYDAVFDWRGGVWAALLLSSTLAFSILVWDKASGLSADEYRAIGVLKAVGWTARDVLELKAWEGALVSLTAALTGLVAAEVHLMVFDGALFAGVLKGWSVLFPTFDVAPEPDASTLLVCLALAVVPYVAASLVPSWRAAITDPDSVIRS
jgi:cell division protein FtsX